MASLRLRCLRNADPGRVVAGAVVVVVVVGTMALAGAGGGAVGVVFVFLLEYIAVVGLTEVLVFLIDGILGTTDVNR